MKIAQNIWKEILVTVSLFMLYIICFGTGNRTSMILVVGWCIAVGAICTWMPEKLFPDETKQDKILKYVNLGIVILCAGAMSLLCIHKSFTYDEAYTIGMINRSYQDIIEITANDVHSPLYYFMLKFLCGSLGTFQLYATKLFSVIFFIGHLALGGVFCRKIYNRKVEFYWLILSGFMPAMVIQASSVRMYSVGLFFFTVTAYLAYSLYKKESVAKWIGFTALSIVTMYIHTFSMMETFVLYLVLLTAFLMKKRYKSLISFFVSGAVAAASYIPWLIVLWQQMRRWAGIEEGWSNTIEELTFYNTEKFFAEWFSSLENPQPLAVVFGVALLIYVVYFVKKHVIETKDYVPYIGLIISGVIVAVAIIVSVRIVPCFLGRYIFPVFGLVWLFVAVGLEKVEKYWKKAVIVVTVLLCGAFAFREEWRLEKDAGIDRYLTFMEQNLDENDVIMADIFTDAMMTIYLPDARNMIYGHKTEGLPFGNLEVFKEWEQLDGVDTVWYIERREGMVNQLSEYFDSEVALRFSFSHYDFILQKATRKE